MIPSITAAPRDMPRSGAAKEAAITQVISTPSTMRRITTLRVWPLSFRMSRLRPALSAAGWCTCHSNCCVQCRAVMRMMNSLSRGDSTV
jgi:hypothetical protein